MVLVIDRPRTSEPANNVIRRWRFWTILRRRAASRQNEPLRAVLAKEDDRLLNDAGLSRDEIVSPAKRFWREWSRVREPWTL